MRDGALSGWRTGKSQRQTADDVVESHTRDVLLLTVCLDHPLCFGFLTPSPTWPGVVADFMAARYTINQCTWLVASGPGMLIGSACVLTEEQSHDLRHAALKSVGNVRILDAEERRYLN